MTEASGGTVPLMAQPCKAPPDKSAMATFRLEDDLRDALELDANTNGRTISQSIRFHLRRALGMAA